MPNYYELLQIAPNATSSDIQSAYEMQYNQWRRLVTHHDPQIVNQANQSLQILETIRDTLCHPEKRSAYDAGIGIGGAIGGLADPNMLLQTLNASPAAILPTPPSAPAKAAPTAAPAPSGLWSCVKCQTDNPPQTKFCFKCGNQLVRQCPECESETSLIATGMCGSCGYQFDVAKRRREIKQELVNQGGLIAATQRDHDVEVTAAKDGRNRQIWGVLAVVAGLFLLVATPNAPVGLLLLLLGGILMFVGTSQHNSHNRKAHNLAEVLAQSTNRVQQMNAELTTTTLPKR